MLTGVSPMTARRVAPENVPTKEKNHESFLLQLIGTGLAHRRETLSNSDQAPGLENKHWADKPQIRGSPSPRSNGMRGT